MNNIIYKKDIKGRLNDIKFYDGGCDIKIGEEKISIEDYHKQDCCEHVYANFEDGINYQEQCTGIDVDGIYIKGVEDEGFLICLSENPLHKIFIGCHNHQNGYYSGELELIINNKIKVDISDFTEYRGDIA